MTNKLLLSVIILGALVLMPSLILGREPFKHLSDLNKTRQTSDETLSPVSCENISLKVFHTDVAKKGIRGSIDFEGVSPQIVEEYYLQATINGDLAFSELNTYGKNVGNFITIHSDERMPISENMEKAWVIDRDALKIMEDAQARGKGSGFNARVINIPSQVISDSDLSSLAQCFTRNASALNQASHWPVAAIVKTKQDARQNFRVAQEFACTTDKITVDGNLIRLNYNPVPGEPAGNIVGTLTFFGNIRKWNSQASSNTQKTPSDLILDISNWESCKNKEEKTFRQYLEEVKSKVVL